MSKAALLVIDVQTGLLNEAYEGEKVLENVQVLIQKARAAQVPVIFVQHDEALEYDGYLHPALAPKADEPIIHKLTPNAFHETNLKTTLDELGVEKLWIAGLATNFCVNASSRAAHDLDYEVVVVEDAHSTGDGAEESAVAIIKRHNAEFAKFAKLVTTAALEFGE